MPVSLAQKRRLLRHLSDRVHWQDDSGAPPERLIRHFFHAVNLKPDSWPIRQGVLLDAAKLTIARDFGIDPGIKAFNEIDKAALAARTNIVVDDWDRLGQVLSMDPDRLVDLDALEMAWNDAADFNGIVGVACQFMADKSEDSVFLRMELENRDRIWAQGHVFRSAMGGTPARKLSDWESIRACKIVDHLLSGTPVQDHLGEAWSYVVLEDRNAGTRAQAIRDIFRRALRIKGEHALAIRFKENRILVAMRVSMLLLFKSAIEASYQIKDGIVRDSIDVEEVQQLLAQGADYRFIDSSAAEKGQSFASLMHEFGRFELLAAYKRKSHIHDLTEEANRPVAEYFRE